MTELKCPVEKCSNSFNNRIDLAYHLFEDHKPFDVANTLAFQGEIN
jgi:hypothetical protein